MHTSYPVQSMGAPYWILLLLVFNLSTRSHVAASASDSPNNPFDNIIQRISRRGGPLQTTLTQSTPALQPTIDNIIENSFSKDIGKHRRSAHRSENSVKTVSSVQVKASKAKTRIRNILDFVGPTGFYYGIEPESMIPKRESRPRTPKPPKVEESMALAVEELKMLRLEMERMRIEIQQLKRSMVGDDDDGTGDYFDDQSSAELKANKLRKRQKEAEKLAAEIESWAITIMQEGEEEGWTPVECSKMIRSTMKGTERTKAFIKWMVDPRGENADKEDQTRHPCIKCTSTIDAPLELVCTYLSQPEASSNYNDVVDKFKDLEEISPDTKICWSSSPQILFVKPRDFVTFCHHRWTADGTEVIVNQACEHPKYPLEKMEKEGKSCRGYALRGANFLSRCTEDPSKTKISIVAHCRPGGGLPDWATKTAVKALAPIEPFKLFHKINDQVIRNKDQLERRIAEAEEVGSSPPPGRSSRPAGFAQIGYACFWPKGGGKYEQLDIATKEEPREDSSVDDNTNLEEDGNSFASEKN